MSTDPLEILETILMASVAKRGEKPLTNDHLLNIVKMARRVQRKREDNHEQFMQDIYNDVMGDALGDS